MPEKSTYGVLRGGLGNQLFQLAAYAALARRSGRPLILDLNSYSHPSQVQLSRSPSAATLGLAPVQRTVSFRSPLLSRLTVASQQMLRTVFDAIPSIQGSFGIVASERAGQEIKGLNMKKSFAYLDSYFGDIYDDVEMQESLSEISRNLHQLRQKKFLAHHVPDDPWVAVHMRMGDYLDSAPSKILSLRQIEEGLQAIDWTMEDKIFLFSDSPELASQFLEPLGASVVIANPNLSDVDTLLLMGSADRLVCSASTFSWWAAKLVTEHGGIVSFPEPRAGDPFKSRKQAGWVWT